jgi:hypothetical protein
MACISPAKIKYDKYKKLLQSNVIYFFMNGFAYIVSAMEVEKEKQILEVFET